MVWISTPLFLLPHWAFIYTAFTKAWCNCIPVIGIISVYNTYENKRVVDLARKIAFFVSKEKGQIWWFPTSISTMKTLGIAFVCVVWAIKCNTERSFRYEERMTMKKAFISDGKPAQSFHNLRKDGHAVNCGSASSRLNLTWTPESIVVGQTVTVYMEMVPDVTLNEGTAHMDLYLGNGTKGEPILQEDSSMKCSQVRKQFPVIKSCPIKSGVPFKGHYSFLMPDLPVGLYTFHVKITNENNKEFACIVLTVRLLSPGK